MKTIFTVVIFMSVLAGCQNHSTEAVDTTETKKPVVNKVFGEYKKPSAKIADYAGK